MANSNLNVTPGSGASVNGYTTPDGDFNQAVVHIDPNTAVTAAVKDVNGTDGAAVVGGGVKEHAALSASALNADLLPSTDVTAYRSFTIQITGTFVANIGLQGSNDGTTWVSVGARNVAALNGETTGPTGTGMFTGNISSKYLRIRVTSYTSGTVNAVVLLHTHPLGFAGGSILVAPNGSFAVIGSSTGATSPTTAFLEGVVGRSSSPTAVTNGQMAAALADLLGTRMVSTGGVQNTAVAAGAASNTVIKATAGRLCRVLVTTAGTNAMHVHDNATTNSGTIIGVIPANAAAGSVYDFGLVASAGITVAGNASNPAVTIGWI